MNTFQSTESIQTETCGTDLADQIRTCLKRSGVFFLNLMGAAGSGKTSMLVRTVNKLKKNYRIAVISAYYDVDFDSQAIVDSTGVTCLPLCTEQKSYVDSQMVNEAIKTLDLSQLDLIVLENVGGLISPAQHDTGAASNVMLLSISDGHNQAVKYPLMFRSSDFILINKIDALSGFDFDMDQCVSNIRKTNPRGRMLTISARDGEGIDKFAFWLENKIISQKES